MLGSTLPAPRSAVNTGLALHIFAVVISMVASFHLFVLVLLLLFVIVLVLALLLLLVLVLVVVLLVVLLLLPSVCHRFAVGLPSV